MKIHFPQFTLLDNQAEYLFFYLFIFAIRSFFSALGKNVLINFSSINLSIWLILFNRVLAYYVKINIVK